ncbi:Transcription factor IWS1 [Grifola frondosa]|uniref:Transcription factor IWS1 n=1 Tax=Grifola frondosa TaxID=5627 RepID=A0A1C7M7U6_GRIFR|nr:Transcription factor IWS1 [Grifola frondosa]
MADEDDSLAIAIFGHSDSDLSSDENDEVPQPPPVRQAPPVREDYESSADSASADEYVQEKRAPKPKRRTRPRRGEDEGEGEPPSSQRKRKRKKAPVDLDQLPPQRAGKAKLDMQIEAILKPKRASRPKRKKKDADEDVLDRYADEEVSRLREAMLAAAADDAQANREKLPATAKLRLLPQVMEVLRKSSLVQSIMDNNLLEGVAKWLEPLPDHSLPALDIQKEFFPILKKMEFIDTPVLKDAKLGKVVIFYTKCKRVTPDIARIANDLVSAWSRPIIKRSASYRDRVIPISQDIDGERGARTGERLNAILARARESDKNRVRKNAVMIPQRELGSYTVAPRANAGMKSNPDEKDLDEGLIGVSPRRAVVYDPCNIGLTTTCLATDVRFNALQITSSTALNLKILCSSLSCTTTVLLPVFHPNFHYR